MILQDPMTSLNPVYTVGNQVIETLRQSDERRSTGLRARAIELLEKVKIPAADTRFANFPHQMSGVCGSVSLGPSRWLGLLTF